MSSTQKIPYLICAGEPSGDLLAAELVEAIRKRNPNLEPWGVTGQAMRRAGVNSIGDISTISVIGFTEVLKHLASIKLFESDVNAKIHRLNPKVAILVDSPGFHFRLAEQLHGQGVKTICYVAPQLWAWGKKRTAKLRKFFDLTLGIMPFEEEFFKGHDVNFKYVGTPQVDRALTASVTKEKFGITSEGPIIGFFSGSRFNEFRKIAPVGLKAAKLVKEKLPDAHIVFSVAPGLPEEVINSAIEKAGFSGTAKPTAIENISEWNGFKFIRGSTLDLMKTSDTALVTSGTATLECALNKTPLAVTYITNPITFWLAKRVVDIPYIALANLVADKMLAREFIQNFSPKDVADELIELTTNEPKRAQVLKDLDELSGRAKGNTAENAADEVLNFMGLK